MGNLEETIAKVAAKARNHRDRNRQAGGRALGETNTRATLIDPILDALGWDIGDVDEVAREYRHEPSDNPIDYALKLDGQPCLLVEAKGLGEPLDDRRWVIQMLTNATGADVEWCVLTDGEQYLFYNALVNAPVERKLFCRVHLGEDPSERAARDLSLLSRPSLGKSLIEQCWTSYFVGSRVKSTVQKLLESRNKSLIALVRKHAPKPALTPKEIASSFPLLAAAVGSASEERSAAPVPARAARNKAPSATRQQRGGAVDSGLDGLLKAGVLKAPLRLFRRYKGRDLEATLNADGSVTFKSTAYRTCSTAAEAARAAVSGRKMNTNGWTFWQYAGQDGKPRTLDAARRDFRARQVR